MNQKGFANIVLVIVIVVLVGAVGYFAFVKKMEPVTQQPTPPATTQTSTPQQPSPTPINETANWKTYKNDTYSFEVKYPPDYYPYEFKGVIYFPKVNDETNWGVTIFVNTPQTNEFCDSEKYVADQKVSMAGDSIISSKVFLSGISKEVSQLKVIYSNRATLLTYIPVKDCLNSKKILVVSASENLMNQYNLLRQTFKFINQ